MISENQLADFYISAMAKVLNDLMQGHADSESKMNTHIRKYLTLEKKHLHKEKLYVIPLCQQELSESKKSKVSTEFQMSDEVEFGEGMHDKFHKAYSKIVHELEKQYTKN